MNSKHRMRSAFLIVTYAIVLYLGILHFDTVLDIIGWLMRVFQPVIYGVVIAFIINLFLNIFRQKVFFKLTQSPKKWGSRLCTILSVIATVFVIAAILASVIFLIIPQLTTAINTLVEKMPTSSDHLLALINEKMIAWNIPQYFIDKVNSIELNWDQIFNFVQAFLDGQFQTVVDTAVSATASVISTLTNFVLGLIIAIYALIQKDKILRFCEKLLRWMIPNRHHELTFRILRLTNQSFASFFTGQFSEAIIIGVLCAAGLALFRFPYAATIGVLVGITALIPIIGAWIGGIIGALLILVEQPDMVIWFIVFILVLQQLEGQLIYPKVVGDSLGLPGLLVLVAVTLGGSFGGITGIFLAVPICAILYTLLREVINQPSKDETPTPVPLAEPAAEPDTAAESPTDTPSEPKA